jgi:hypothetical protein
VLVAMAEVDVPRRREQEQQRQTFVLWVTLRHQLQLCAVNANG